VSTHRLHSVSTGQPLDFRHAFLDMAPSIPAFSAFLRVGEKSSAAVLYVLGPQGKSREGVHAAIRQTIARKEEAAL
jgi:hypothetical protein